MSGNPIDHHHQSIFNWANLSISSNSGLNLNASSFNPSYLTSHQTNQKQFSGGDFGRTYTNTNTRGGKFKATRGGAHHNKSGADYVQQREESKVVLKVREEPPVKGNSVYDIVANCIDSLADDICGEITKKAY